MAAKPRSNRRQFLSGQSALDAVSHLADGMPPPSAYPQASAGPDASFLIQIDRRAMACEFQILLNAGQHLGGTEAALDALDLVERLEDQLSWFRDTSELSCINRMAARSPVVVERRLFQLLCEAVRLSEQTDGAFDITAGPLWKLWGFHRREGQIPSQEAIRETLQRTGALQLRLDPETRTIRFAREGVEINLGAIGKGYAVDRCGEQLVAAGVANFLIHAGHSSMLAAGSRAGVSQHQGGWTIALRHPLRPDQRLAEIHLRDRALGTSGSGNQFFHFHGKRYGHVLDPRTGHPAQTLLSATALASTAAEADALATAFFVMGLDASIAYCRQRPEIGALLVAAGQQAGAIDLHTIGIAADQWQRVA